MSMETVLRQLARYETTGHEALEILAEFQRLTPRTAEEITQLMASLCGAPARVADPLTSMSARCRPDGSDLPLSEAIRSDWPAAPVLSGEPPALWLELDRDVHVRDAAVLEGAAQAMLSLRRLEETQDEVEQEAFVDALTEADPILQQRALERLALHPSARCTVTVRPGNVAQILVSPSSVPHTSRESTITAMEVGTRLGLSPMLTATELPQAWDAARTALAFAADGTDADPGEQCIRYEDLGVWGDLVAHYRLDGRRPADVTTIDELADTNPWAIETLSALTRSSSAREAATRSFVHHSTMQSRQAVLESCLGWDLSTPTGRTRTSMALALRRFLLHPPIPEPPTRMDPPILVVSPEPPRHPRR